MSQQHQENERSLNVGHIIEQTRGRAKPARLDNSRARPQSKTEPAHREQDFDASIPVTLGTRLTQLSVSILIIVTIAWAAAAEFRLRQVQQRLDAAELSLELASVSLNGLDQLSIEVRDLQQRLDNIAPAIIPTSVSKETGSPDEPGLSEKNGTSSDAPPAAERPTETVHGNSVPDHTWFINIATVSSKSSALQLQKQVRNLGQEAGIVPVLIEGRRLYRVRIQGLESRNLAEREALRLQIALDLSGMWVAAQ